jgi:Asp-tRNA(Asn)/Glu-tRNA(Gln) amidotransferase A subunit family amidase
MLRELAESIRSGRVSAVDVVNESIRRIEASKDLNAVTALYAEEALHIAATQKSSGPLAGVPFLVKDMARVKGHVTTSGSLLYANGEPDAEDDTVVARLREAGAIVLGRTNSPEFGATAYTNNKVFGATRNPWNKDRSPGGSSGGSAAALAAGLAPIATTSDGGGSVRGPASMSGLVGYKPTMGAIGRNILPRWIEFSTQGATASLVDDVVLQAEIVLGHARGDFLGVPRAGVSLTPRTPKRVVAVRTFRADVDPEIEENFERTLAVIAKSGIEVVRSESPTSPDAVIPWFIISTAELTQSLRHEEARWSEMSDYVQEQLKFGSRVTAEQYIAAQRERHAMSARFDDLLTPDTVIVVPTANARAWPAEGPMASSAGKVEFDSSIALNTTDCNFTGHPAVSVPMGVDNHGVPTGLQVIAPRFDDGLALGLAAFLEREQPWPLVAPGYSPFPTFA